MDFSLSRSTIPDIFISLFGEYSAENYKDGRILSTPVQLGLRANDVTHKP